jgi:hypothetical protein
MKSEPRGRTGILVIRVWMERPAQMRARITHTLDVSSAREAVTTAMSPGQISEMVASWLDAFTAGERSVASPVQDDGE